MVECSQGQRSVAFAEHKKKNADDLHDLHLVKGSRRDGFPENIPAVSNRRGWFKFCIISDSKLEKEDVTAGTMVSNTA